MIYQIQLKLLLFCVFVLTSSSTITALPLRARYSASPSSAMRVWLIVRWFLIPLLLLFLALIITLSSIPSFLKRCLQRKDSSQPYASGIRATVVPVAREEDISLDHQSQAPHRAASSIHPSHCNADAFERQQCVICLDILLGESSGHPIVVSNILDCGHRFHVECLQRLEDISRNERARCPLCRRPFRHNDHHLLPHKTNNLLAEQ